jgi:Phytanoyl-CoA dioxygenase (PhyH)
MNALKQWFNLRYRESRAAAGDCDPTCREWVDSFYRTGFVVIDEGGETAGELANIEREFDTLVGEPSLVHHEYENGFYTAVSGSTVMGQTARFPALSRFLGDQRIQQVIKGYLERFLPDRRLVEKTILHEQLDLEVNSRPGSTDNSVWHFDRMPSIKTCLFLTDVSEEPDAFLVVPGSHFVVRDRFLNFLRTNPDPLFVDNRIDFHAPVTPVSFRIRPGMIVLFDTLTMHRGGVIRSERVRKAIRTVTWPPRLSTEYFTWTSPDDEAVPSLNFTTSYPFDRTGQKMQDPRFLFAG